MSQAVITTRLAVGIKDRLYSLWLGQPFGGTVLECSEGAKADLPVDPTMLLLGSGQGK